MPDNRSEQRNHEMTGKSAKYTTDYHSGVWEFNKVENRYMWSDTGSFDFESKGDIRKVHNANAMNLEGTNKSRQ